MLEQVQNGTTVSRRTLPARRAVEDCPSIYLARLIPKLPVDKAEVELFKQYLRCSGMRKAALDMVVSSAII